jgi:threonine dehydrogenase-like Zn-dependent dehydrogenase
VRAVVMRAEWSPRRGYAVSDEELRTGRATMGSGVLRAPTFAWEDVADPTPGPDECLLRVRACGVCGSDTHCYERDAEGYMLFSGPTRVPCIVGHEYAAEVVDVGEDVRRLSPGDLVVGEGMLSCGTCETCRRGRPNQCPSLEMLGFSAPGAFAPALVAKERFLWSIRPLAESLGDAQRACELGALVEPVACAFNGMFVSAGGMAPGAHVAVFGCGPIGLGAIALARAAGAATVAAFEVVGARRELALRIGADLAVDPTQVDAAETIRELTRGAGADLLVEAAGAALQTMPSIERAFAAGGRMVYLGRTGQRAPVMLDVLVSRAAGIVGARGHSGGGCFPAILRLLERGRLSLAPMITTRVPAEKTLDALEMSTDRTDGKVMIYS